MSLVDQILGRVRAGEHQALETMAHRVLDEAARNAPPSDPETDPDPEVTLRESGRIEPDGAGFIVIFDTPYAAKIHEDLRLHHPHGGGAKYLERALTTLAPQLEGLVASEVTARMASGLSTDLSRPHR